MSRRERLPLSCQSGLYLIDFADDTVKVGRSANLRGRIRKHVKTGAVQVQAWVLDSTCTYITADGALASIERGALNRLAREGEQIGASERVRGVPFTRACELIDELLQRRWEGPIAAHPGDTLDELLGGPIR